MITVFVIFNKVTTLTDLILVEVEVQTLDSIQMDVIQTISTFIIYFSKYTKFAIKTSE